MIGIDVGGANLKVADDNGIHIHYCPLWSGAPIAGILCQYSKERNTGAAVVMSGELADCFENKTQGIAFIVNAVREVFPAARFYGTDATFHDRPVPELAAANWLASADFLREKYPDALLLDIGSTTADFIPLSRFSSLKGLSDLARLQKGYLVYTGMLRTPVATLLSSVDLDGIPTPVSTEYFAASGDAHLVLGHIRENDYSCDTPDHKEKTRGASLRRLARVVCADLEEIGENGARQIAEAFWERQQALVCDAVHRVTKETETTTVVVAGLGSALFARVLRGIDLSQEIGPAADALPAYAVREVALRKHGN
ncbi:MAG: hydantoinase/oxoprolinase family protein [Methanoregula sp.]|uniref:hydantoinase/oxoprolinase family protein n=1 Tax=Methanoregula sp. TaxID=2052170 RepID=UPI003BB153BC